MGTNARRTNASALFHAGLKGLSNIHNADTSKADLTFGEMRSGG